MYLSDASATWTQLSTCCQMLALPQCPHEVDKKAGHAASTKCRVEVNSEKER